MNRTPLAMLQRCFGSLVPIAVFVVLLFGLGRLCFAAAPQPPESITATDHGWDNGTAVDLTIRIPEQISPETVEYRIDQCGEFRGIYHPVKTWKPTPEEIQAGVGTVTITDVPRNMPLWFRVVAVNEQGEQSSFVGLGENSPVIATREGFDSGKFWLLVMTCLICGSIIGMILLARSGMSLRVRPIAGLEAIEEAVGRATEMGRSCLFVPGIQDMNEMQTIAGLTLLGRVAERAAEYDCELETPTSKSLVMTAARETVANAFLAAGRPDAYREDLVYYVTDEQFAYVSFLTGKMVRERPAACFYLGSFYAESLILAETGNSIGAIQIAGTAQPAQLPFFVAACDYTLIGEEFFAASAYLSGDPDQLGSLKGQDIGKAIGLVLILVIVSLGTIANLTAGTDFVWLHDFAARLSDYLSERVLSS